MVRSFCEEIYLLKQRKRSGSKNSIQWSLFNEFKWFFRCYLQQFWRFRAELTKKTNVFLCVY